METPDNNPQENTREQAQTGVQTPAPTDPPPTPTGSSNDEGAASYAQERAQPAVAIKPTIGRVLWFWSEELLVEDTQPEAAIVVYVHNDQEVSLVVFDRFGAPRPELRVWLESDSDAAPRPTHRYAQWMPYQVGQARAQAAGAKTADSEK